MEKNYQNKPNDEALPANIHGVSTSIFSVTDLFNISREKRDFICDYIDTINGFFFRIKTYNGPKDDLGIQNTDLWIESYIDIVPDLQEFRKLVRAEMKRLGIERLPDYTYDKKINHFYYSNMRKLEELRLSL
jgi:hypothetical protein